MTEEEITASGERSIAIGNNANGNAIYAGDQFINILVNKFSDKNTEKNFKDRKEYEYQQYLLHIVKITWIEGILKNTLRNQPLIKLRLEKRLDLVKCRFSDIPAISDELRQTSGKTIADELPPIEKERTILILGEPGYGKTTILLALAQDLIKCAEKDLSRQIPVVLNLSSWDKKKQKIVEWLIQELKAHYHIPENLGKQWIEDEQLILLLDGLDEVKLEYRETCVQVLNQFIQEHGITAMIVCCRTQEYKAISERFIFESAFCIQPLNIVQINQYLDKKGNNLANLKNIFQEYPTLKKLAKSPLMLNIMALTYHRDAFKDIYKTDDLKQQQKNLFDAYIKSRFTKLKSKQLYSSKQAVCWLSWLAQQMIQECQTIFLIEGLQPSWLQSKTQEILYRVGSILIGGVSTGLVSGSITLLLSLLFGLGLGPALNNGLITWRNMSIICGLIIAQDGAEIQTIETLKFSWQKIKQGFFNGLIAGGLGGLFLGLLYHEKFDPIKKVVNLFIFILCFGVIGILMNGLVSGFVGPKIRKKINPNQGIWNTAKNAWKFGIIIMLTAMVLAAPTQLILAGINHNMSYDKFISPYFAGYILDWMAMGLVLGLVGSGKACIKHFTLRLILYCKGCIPWNYTRFLNYAANDLIFLQKFGGGYIFFMHPMLRDYFAYDEAKLLVSPDTRRESRA